MGMAQLVVTAVLVEGRPKAEVARDYGVSRRWVITLVQRFLAEGEPGLRTPFTTAALTVPAAPPRRSRTRSSRCAKTSTGTGTRPAPRRSPPTSNNATAPTGAGGVDDLADPVRPRIRHPTTAQTPEIQLPAVLRRRPERALATRHHPLPPRRRLRGRRCSTSSTTTPGSASPAPLGGSSPPATSQVFGGRSGERCCQTETAFGPTLRSGPRSSSARPPGSP